jgi:hypothetical protein
VGEELPEFWDHVDEEARSTWLAFAIVPSAEQKAPASVTKDELRWSRAGLRDEIAAEAEAARSNRAGRIVTFRTNVLAKRRRCQ